MLMAGVSTFICSMAVCSVMEKYCEFSLLRTEKVSSIFISILIGIGAGAVLSVINYFLAKGSGNSLDFKISFNRILVALNPGIYEEIACRAIFMAFCLYFMRGQKASKWQIFTMWFMMALPHTLSHGYGLVESLILLVLFGLPFTALLRKRDLTSAMIAHGLVDAVRFTIFGL